MYYITMCLTGTDIDSIPLTSYMRCGNKVPELVQPHSCYEVVK